MSISKWAIYGYGVNILPQEINVKKVFDFLIKGNHLEEEDTKLLKEIKEPNFSDIEEHWGCFYEFIDEFLSIIELDKELDKIDRLISWGDDGDIDDGGIYLMYTPNYPWRMSNSEKSLSKELVQDKIIEIVSILTDLKRDKIMERFDDISTSGEG